MMFSAAAAAAAGGGIAARPPCVGAARGVTHVGPPTAAGCCREWSGRKGSGSKTPSTVVGPINRHLVNRRLFKASSLRGLPLGGVVLAASTSEATSTETDPQLLTMKRIIAEAMQRGIPDLHEESVPDEYRNAQWGGETRTGTEQRMDISCQVFSSPTFRRISQALIRVEGGFQAFLICSEPRDCFNIPMFGAEVVSRGGRVTVAFTDCSPVNEDHSLPAQLANQLEALQARHGLERMQMRKVPQEFKEVFSDMCVVKMPQGDSIDDFLQYLRGALDAYHSLAHVAEPIESQGQQALILAAQRRYSELGLSNAEKKVVPVMRQCASPDEVARFLRWLWLDE